MLTFFFFIFSQTNLSATPSDSLHFWKNATELNQLRVIGLMTTKGVLFTGSMIGLSKLWYADYPRQNFHFFNDNATWLQMDKYGHLYSSYTLERLFMAANQWAGFSRRQARLISGISSWLYLGTIETLDGFSSGWGFSFGDLLANTAGVVLFMGQDMIWQEQRITLKYSFRKSKYAAYRPELLGRNYPEQLFKDYNGQTYWLSINIADFLNEKTRFPKWLNIAIGHGAEGMTGGQINPVLCDASGNCINFERYRQYYLSFDIDCTRINAKKQWLKSVLWILGRIKVPAPGLVYGNKQLGFVFQ